VAFWAQRSARVPFPCACCAPPPGGLHAPLRRFTKPPTPMAGVSRHTRFALPVAWPPARFGGRVGCGPAPSSTRACITPWLRPSIAGIRKDTKVAAIPVWARSATGPDPRRAHPRTESARRPLRPAGKRANAPQRVEIGARQVDSLHPAPGRGSLGSSLRDSVVGNPHNSFKIRAEQIRLRIRSEKNQT